MLMIFSDVETLDNRCADRAQLIHDDGVPLLPARREPGPRRSLTVSDLLGAWHRPSHQRSATSMRASATNCGSVIMRSWPVSTSQSRPSARALSISAGSRDAKIDM